MNISLFLAFSKTKLITFGSSVFILVYIVIYQGRQSRSRTEVLQRQFRTVGEHIILNYSCESWVSFAIKFFSSSYA